MQNDQQPRLPIVYVPGSTPWDDIPQHPLWTQTRGEKAAEEVRQRAAMAPTGVKKLLAVFRR